jgi:hypothetical protein
MDQEGNGRSARRSRQHPKPDRSCSWILSTYTSMLSASIRLYLLNILTSDFSILVGVEVKNGKPIAFAQFGLSSERRPCLLLTPPSPPPPTMLRSIARRLAKPQPSLKRSIIVSPNPLRATASDTVSPTSTSSRAAEKSICSRAGGSEGSTSSFGIVELMADDVFPLLAVLLLLLSCVGIGWL